MAEPRLAFAKFFVQPSSVKLARPSVDPRMDIESAGSAGIDCPLTAGWHWNTAAASQVREETLIGSQDLLADRLHPWTMGSPSKCTPSTVPTAVTASATTEDKEWPSVLTAALCMQEANERKRHQELCHALDALHESTASLLECAQTTLQDISTHVSHCAEQQAAKVAAAAAGKESENGKKVVGPNRWKLGSRPKLLGPSLAQCKPSIRKQEQPYRSAARLRTERSEMPLSPFNPGMHPLYGYPLAALLAREPGKPVMRYRLANVNDMGSIRNLFHEFTQSTECLAGTEHAFTVPSVQSMERQYMSMWRRWSGGTGSAYRRRLYLMYCIEQRMERACPEDPTSANVEEILEAMDRERVAASAEGTVKEYMQKVLGYEEKGSTVNMRLCYL